MNKNGDGIVSSTESEKQGSERFLFLLIPPLILSLAVNCELIYNRKHPTFRPFERKQGFRFCLPRIYSHLVRISSDSDSDSDSDSAAFVTNVNQAYHAGEKNLLSSYGFAHRKF